MEPSSRKLLFPLYAGVGLVCFNAPSSPKVEWLIWPLMGGLRRLFLVPRVFSETVQNNLSARPWETSLPCIFFPPVFLFVIVRVLFLLHYLIFFQPNCKVSMRFSH